MLVSIIISLLFLLKLTCYLRPLDWQLWTTRCLETSLQETLLHKFEEGKLRQNLSWNYIEKWNRWERPLTSTLFSVERLKAIPWNGVQLWCFLLHIWGLIYKFASFHGDDDALEVIGSGKAEPHRTFSPIKSTLKLPIGLPW